MSFKQVAAESVPTRMDRHVAFIPGSIETLSQALEISFEEIDDQLGHLLAAKIVTVGGVEAVLGYYPDAPILGLDVYVATGCTSPEHALAEILAALGDVGLMPSWISPDLA